MGFTTVMNKKIPGYTCTDPEYDRALAVMLNNATILNNNDSPIFTKKLVALAKQVYYRQNMNYVFFNNSYIDLTLKDVKKAKVMLNFKKIEEHVKNGLITKRKHPTQDLWIYNYSQKCQFDGAWDNETISCRGLIVDENNNIVSRPFKKFFNIEELQGLRNKLHHLYDVKYSDIYTMPFTCLEKMDGSLGISYKNKDGTYSIATRGSFESDQAIKATEILNTKYKDVNFANGFTYLFEIIYKENRIVLDYGDVEDLYLLAIIDNICGTEYSPVRPARCNVGVNFNTIYDYIERLPFPKPKLYDGISGMEELAGKSEDNKEGIVLNFGNGFRAKYKYEIYKKLHRIMTGVTPKRVLDVIKTGQTLESWLEGVPDEFFVEIQQIAFDFHSSYARIEAEAKEEFEKFKKCETKKEFAMAVVKHRYSSVIFAMYDKKEYQSVIWNFVEKEIA